MLQDRLLMFGVAGLAALATAGWMRNPVPVAAQNGLLPPAFQEVQTTSAPLTPVDYRTPFGAPAYSARRASPERAPVQMASRARRAPAAYDDRGYSTVEPRRERSKLKSAAIIGGGAAAGAAIGAAAGGGKGAAIGAVGGGAAGLIYDRMTRNGDNDGDDRAYRTSRENRTRSTGQSAAIIGGGAAAGAAVGAAAGGGKGAAIGALTGGAAGYVYDRMTRNK